MRKPPSEGLLLYHFTLIENLPSILENGLFARSTIDVFKNIADREIIKKRDELGLLEYVPFHFMYLSPFAGAVEKDRRSSSFAYITVSRYTAARENYKIILSHPLHLDSTNFELYDYKDGIKRLNWKLIDQLDYRNQACKNECLAECLAYKHVKPTEFSRIFVKNEKEKERFLSKNGSIITKNRIIIEARPQFFATR